MHDRYLQLFKEVDEEDNGSMDFPEFLLMMRKSAAQPPCALRTVSESTPPIHT